MTTTTDVRTDGIRRWTPVSLVLALMASLVAASLFAPANAATGLVISGRVLNADGQGIEDVTVVAARYSSSDGEWHRDYLATTTATGTYSVNVKSSSSYKLQFIGYSTTSVSYAPTWYPGTDLMSSAKVVKVASSSIRQINVSMNRGGVVSGRIYQPDGTPAPAGTAVRAFPSSVDPDQVSDDWGYMRTTTHTGGDYSIPGLRAGSYRILSEPSPLHGAPTWLGQTSYFNTASDVAVVLGEEKGSNDITLSVPGTMGGQALHPATANSRPPVQIRIYDRFNRQIKTSTVSDANGHWFVDGLAPGEYYVGFYADNLWTVQWYGPSETQTGSPLLTVQSGANTPVNNTLVYASLKNVKRPHIAGTRKVGRYLKYADDSTWNHKPTYLRYRWYRDGAAIRGATGHAYKLRSVDAGHRISLRVYAIRKPYESASAISPSTASIRR